MHTLPIYEKATLDAPLATEQSPILYLNITDEDFLLAQRLAEKKAMTLGAYLGNLLGETIEREWTSAETEKPGEPVDQAFVEAGTADSLRE